MHSGVDTTGESAKAGETKHAATSNAEERRVDIKHTVIMGEKNRAAP